MKIFLKITLTFLFVTQYIFLRAQTAPVIQWQKCFGGNINDEAWSIKQTTDGGFIIAGTSDSNNGDISGDHGYNDYWIVRTDAAANLLWQKCLGGTGGDHVRVQPVQQTSDGGFIVAGITTSVNGDVTGNHGNSDYWIVKLDADGNIVWQKCFGGHNHDNAYAIIPTMEGGFTIAGYSNSVDGDVSGNNGEEDYWIVMLDTVGNLIWQKSFGGSNTDIAYSIQQTADSGFIIAGGTASIDSNVTENHGEADYWIVKLNTDSSIVWQKCLGGSKVEWAHYIQQTSDGGYIATGYTESNDGDVSVNHGGYDWWVVKLDTIGNLIWEKSLGGSDDEKAYCVEQTADNGYIVAGYTNSNDGDVTGNHGGADYWLVKLDTAGSIVWQKTFGGSLDELAHSILEIADDQYIVAGYSRSNDGDVSGNHAYEDYWIVKLAGYSGIETNHISGGFISIYPNPAQTWITLNLASSASETIIRVYDLQGRMQDCGLWISDFGLNNSIQVNIENLPDGFYTIQILNNKTGKIEAGKFVKQ